VWWSGEPDSAAIGAARWSFPGPEKGKIVSTRQNLVEANAVRVIVECEWVLQEQAAAATPAPESVSRAETEVVLQRSTYAVYASGHAYVTTTCATGADLFADHMLGLVVSLASMPDWRVSAHEPGSDNDRPILEDLAYGWFAGERDLSGLLWVSRDGKATPKVKVVRGDDDARMSLCAYGGPVARPTHTWHSLLNVWPPANCAEPARQATAISFCHRPKMAMLAGELVRDSAGDDDGDGFNERDGTYVLRPLANCVQLRLDGRQRPMVNPAFSVRDVGEREAWVYVNHVLHGPVARDAERHLVFEIPVVVGAEMIVEVYLREPPSDLGGAGS
jgi:hypothetical protein